MYRSKRHLLEEEGFGLMELVISMTFIAVAMAAISSLLVSSFIGTRNAATRATAGALADGQMEIYYRVPYANVRLKATGSGNSGGDLSTASIPSSDVYKTSFGATGFPTSSSLIKDTDTVPAACTAESTSPECRPIPLCLTEAHETPECKPIQYMTASTSPASPDGHSYRIDTYIYTPSASVGTSLKEVLIVVRDYKGNTPGKVLATADSLISPIAAPS